MVLGTYRRATVMARAKVGGWAARASP
jgi:hypothetical protein